MKHNLRDPREEKVRDYLYQRRNSYGENSKSSRKSVRFRKKTVNRQNRRRVSTKLGQVPFDDELQSGGFIEDKTNRWKKEPDLSLLVLHSAGDSNRIVAASEKSVAQREAIRRIRAKRSKWG